MSLEYLDNYLFRRYRKPGKITAMSKREKPWLSMIKDRIIDGGSDWNTPALLSGGRGYARTRAQVQAIHRTPLGNGAFAQWRNSPGTYAGGYEISNREIALSKGAEAAFAKAQGIKADAHVGEFGSIMARGILGPPGWYLFTGTCTNGVISITAAEAFRVGEVELGDQLVASADPGDDPTDSELGGGSVGHVINISRSATTKTITVSPTPEGAAGTPAGWTGTMYFFRRGEMGGGVDRGADNNSRFVIDSVQAWVPETEPSDTYKNVDRSRDSRLSGCRQLAADVATMTIEEVFESLYDLGRTLYGWKGKKKFFVHTTRFRQLTRSLENRRLRGGGSFEKGERKGGGSEDYASFSYAYVSLTTQEGSYEIIDDPHMPADYALCMDPDDWEIVTAAGFPEVIDHDKNKVLRHASEDVFEFREAVYGSFQLKPEAQISQTGRTPLPAAA
jgi:hypothetical protein